MSRIYFLLLFLLLAGCARPVKPVLTDLPEVETLLQQLSATTGQINSLDSAAAVKLTIKGKRISSQQFLLLEKPDRLRADVLTGFGKLLLQLTTDGKELSVLVNTTSPARFYRGPATTENVVRFTRIPLATKDIVRLLLYDPPLIGYQQEEILAEGGNILLRLKNPDLQQELIFNQQLQLIGCRYFSADNLFLKVLFQKFDSEPLFPRTIYIDLVAEETEAVINLSDLLFNIDIPTDRFRLKQPETIPVEILP
ncbi:hypothetical protein N9063_00105 [Deltaproteobacteria bacterium]|nr:hypothetical protein [Deltaproteobacteria bacterium]